MKGKGSGKRQKVEIIYENSGALEVRLVGDFNDWNTGIAIMARNENGTWRKTIMLPPGDYEYKFLVDGRWENDPSNINTRENCFGTLNNLLRI